MAPIAAPRRNRGLSISTRSEGVHTIVAVVGELDVHTVPRLLERLAALIADGHYHLVVDLQGVDFLDSTGLGVLVGGLKRVHPRTAPFNWSAHRNAS